MIKIKLDINDIIALLPKDEDFELWYAEATKDFNFTVSDFTKKLVKNGWDASKAKTIKKIEDLFYA